MAEEDNLDALCDLLEEDSDDESFDEKIFNLVDEEVAKIDKFDSKRIFVRILLFPFDCLIRLNKGKNNQGKTLNCFPNILLAANKILSSNFIKRAISCSPVSFLEQKCEANFMIVLFAVHFLKGSDPIGFLLFSFSWQSGVGFLY